MAENFSPSLLKFLKSTFDDFDTDKDGKLTKEDIAKMIRFSSGKNPSKEQVQFHFNEFDMDDNHTVDFNEYVAVVARKLADGAEDRVVKSFQLLDKDGDGVLSRADLKQTFNDKQVDEIMKKYDQNNNGTLEKEEFVKWVKENRILGELFSLTSKM